MSRVFKYLAALPALCMGAGSYGQFTEVASLFNINNVATGTYDGCGMSFYDFNYDGWDDLTLGNGNEDILFYQNANGEFELVDLGINNIDDAQVKMVLWGDYDNDHDADLLVTHDLFPTRLWRNNGDMTFSEVSALVGISPGYYHYFGAAWSDVDKDGFLDLFIAEFYNPSLNPGYEYQWKFYQNNGNGTFTENSAAVGLAFPPRPAFQPVFLDYDKDGWSDLFVVIDREAWNCEMFHNNGNGTFTNVTEETNTGPDTGGPMSGTVDDMDNDGDLDIFISSDETGNVLLENNNNYFDNIAVDAGVTVGAICWGALWLDYDNNSWQDLFVGTTIGAWGPFQNKWFINNQDNTFEAGNALLGTATDFAPSIVACQGDYNNDGYFDYATNNNDPYPTDLWLNDGGDNNYLSVTLQGTWSNYDAIGAWITCYAGGQEYIRYTISGENCIGQNARREIFGLGTNTVVDSLVVLWPLGLQEIYYNLDVNQHLLLTEGAQALEPFDLEYSGNTVICPGDSIVLSAGDYPQYLWSTGEITPDITVTESGTYWVTVTNESGLENTSNELAIIVLPQTNVNVLASNATCYAAPDGWAECMIEPGEIEYILWDDGQTTALATGLEAGIYNFAGSTTQGCAFAGQVAIAQPDSLTVIITTANVLCHGETSGTAQAVVNGGTPPYNLDWMGNIPQQLNAGNYQMTVTDSNLCEVLAFFEITEPAALELQLDTTAQFEGGELGTAAIAISGGSPPYEVLWSNNVADSLFIQGLVAGLYSVEVTDSLGCNASATFTVEFVPGVFEGAVSDQVLIHPNPAKDYFEIEFIPDNKFLPVFIYDSKGRLVYKRVDAGRIRIETGGWAAGRYTIVDGRNRMLGEVQLLH